MDRERIYLEGRRTEVERGNGGEGRGCRGGCRRGCRLKPGARTGREDRAGRAGSSRESESPSQNLRFPSKAGDEAICEMGEPKRPAGRLGDCEEHAVSFLPRYHQCGARGRLGDCEEHSVSFRLRYHQYRGGKGALGQEFAH